MQYHITVLPYSTEHGLRLHWNDNAEIRCSADGNEVTIHANKEGLITLATHLLTIAQDDAPEYSHLHLDDSNGLEDGSAELIISKHL